MVDLVVVLPLFDKVVLPLLDLVVVLEVSLVLQASPLPDEVASPFLAVL